MAEDKDGEYVVGLLLDPGKQKVILIRKERPTWMRGRWNGPGGHIQVGETPYEAVRREFNEETGVDVAPWQLLAVMDVPRVTAVGRATVHFYAAATEDFWKVKSQTDEVVQGFSIRDLPFALLPNLRWLIPMAAYDLSANWPYSLVQEGQ